MNANIGKMFGVLVLGGSSLIANASEIEKPKADEKACRVELRQKNYDATDFNVCLDEEDPAKTLGQILKENPPDDGGCMTPFCGCWLG
jgi:hypothetical protein